MNLPFQKSHAFLIGINDYQNVSRLHTAVNDAKVLAEKLSTDHKYIVHGPLLNPTKADIETYFESTVQKVVSKEDRVLFYFAGHGIAQDMDNGTGPNGYLVPVDAQRGKPESMISMKRLHDVLTSLPCRHGLLILDCCFSGAFKWFSGFRDMLFDLPGVIYEQRFYQYLKDPAWQVITSSASDQKTVDVLENHSLGLRGTEQQNHSPFALALLEGISGAADVVPKEKGDGVITTTELYTYLRDRVEDETMAQSKRQSPSLFSLKNHDKGQFVFLHPRHRFNLPPMPNRNPYMSLESYNESDASFFYGRDRVITALRAKIETQPFVVVSGASGTGKSSVIKAGLIPELRKEKWKILPIVRPGENPLENLQLKIPNLEKELSNGTKAVLLIDQYEELITRCLEEEERQAFEQQLAQWLKEHPTLKIIISVRSDFEPQFRKSPLSQWWIKGKYSVPAFSTDELREVIIKPTIQEVLVFEPDNLVQELVDAVNEAPGALPLLSFTLSELYHAYLESGRTNRALTKEDYDKLGGVIGALSHQADKVYLDLKGKEASQNSMRQLVLRMVAVEGVEYAGKRVLLEDLQFADKAETERVKEVANLLVEKRLLQQGTNEKDQIYIEPAHDALVRAWPRLREWVKTIGENKLSWQNKLTVAVRDYETLKKENPKKAKNLLWNKNPRLDLLKAELVGANHSFNSKEQRFVQESLALKTKIKRQLIIGGLAIIAFLSVASVFSWLQKGIADDKTIEAEIAALVTQSQANKDSDPYLSLFQAKAAWDKTKEPTSEAQQALFSSFINQFSKIDRGQIIRPARPLARDLSYLHPKGILSMTFSNDGQWLLSASNDHSASMLHIEKDSIIKLNGHLSPIKNARFSSNDQYILTHSEDGLVKLWESNGNKILDVTHNEEPIETAAFSSKSEYLFTNSKTKAKILNLNSRQVKEFSMEGDSIIAIRFLPDGKQFVIVSKKEIQLRQIDNPDLINNRFRYAQNGKLSPKGNFVLESNGYLWEIGGRPVGQLIGLATPAKEPFSLDEKLILGIHENGNPGIWDIHGDLVELLWNPTEELVSEKEIPSLQFSPNGEYILSLEQLRFGADKPIITLTKLWNAEGRLVKNLSEQLGEVTNLLFTPDNKHFISTGGGAVRLWNLEGKAHKLYNDSKRSIQLDRLQFSSDGANFICSTPEGFYSLYGNGEGEIVNIENIGAVIIDAGFVENKPFFWVKTINEEKRVWDFKGNLVTAEVDNKNPPKDTLGASKKDSLSFEILGENLLVRQQDKGLIAIMDAHIKGIPIVKQSPDRKFVLTCGRDFSVKLWPTPNTIYNWTENADLLPLSIAESIELHGEQETRLVETQDPAHLHNLIAYYAEMKNDQKVVELTRKLYGIKPELVSKEALEKMVDIIFLNNNKEEIQHLFNSILNAKANNQREIFIITKAIISTVEKIDSDPFLEEILPQWTVEFLKVGKLIAINPLRDAEVNLVREDYGWDIEDEIAEIELKKFSFSQLKEMESLFNNVSLEKGHLEYTLSRPKHNLLDSLYKLNGGEIIKLSDFFNPNLQEGFSIYSLRDFFEQIYLKYYFKTPADCERAKRTFGKNSLDKQTIIKNKGLDFLNENRTKQLQQLRKKPLKEEGIAFEELLSPKIQTFFEVKTIWDLIRFYDLIDIFEINRPPDYSRDYGLRFLDSNEYSEYELDESDDENWIQEIAHLKKEALLLKTLEKLNRDKGDTLAVDKDREGILTAAQFWAANGKSELAFQMYKKLEAMNIAPSWIPICEKIAHLNYRAKDFDKEQDVNKLLRAARCFSHQNLLADAKALFTRVSIIPKGVERMSIREKAKYLNYTLNDLVDTKDLEQVNYVLGILNNPPMEKATRKTHNGLKLFGRIFTENANGLVTEMDGASLICKGTAMGTVSQSDGSFSLEIPPNVTTVLITYQGFQQYPYEIDPTKEYQNIIIYEARN